MGSGESNLSGLSDSSENKGFSDVLEFDNIKDVKVFAIHKGFVETTSLERFLFSERMKLIRLEGGKCALEVI